MAKWVLYHDFHAFPEVSPLVFCLRLQLFLALSLLLCDDDDDDDYSYYHYDYLTYIWLLTHNRRALQFL